jgi:hypothetical protein
MHLSPILSPSGEPVFAVGHRHSWKQGTHKGFNISLEWIGEGRKSQPCLCIWAATNIFTQNATENGVWVIGRRAITEFVGFNKNNTCTGAPSEHCFREAREALPLLGKDKNDQQALNALCDVVITYAPDLVMMPITPLSIRTDLEAEKMWEIVATNKDSGKVLTEVTL